MKKLIAFVTSIAMFCLSGLTVLAAGSTDYLDLMHQLGQCERPLTASEKGKVALQGNTISIYQGELEQAAQSYRIKGKDHAQECAKQYLLKREALYQKSLTVGNRVTDDEVFAEIERQKEIFHEVDINPDEMNAYFEGMEMSIDEYWDSQFDALKKEMITSKYTSKQKEQFFRQHNLDRDAREKWQDELTKIADAYIMIDHVKTQK